MGRHKKAVILNEVELVSAYVRGLPGVAAAVAAHESAQHISLGGNRKIYNGGKGNKCCCTYDSSAVDADAGGRNGREALVATGRRREQLGDVRELDILGQHGFNAAPRQRLLCQRRRADANDVVVVDVSERARHIQGHRRQKAAAGRGRGVVGGGCGAAATSACARRRWRERNT
jgi:hypothetical protein